MFTYNTLFRIIPPLDTKQIKHATVIIETATQVEIIIIIHKIIINFIIKYLFV